MASVVQPDLPKAMDRRAGENEGDVLMRRTLGFTMAVSFLL